MLPIRLLVESTSITSIECPLQSLSRVGCVSEQTSVSDIGWTQNDIQHDIRYGYLWDNPVDIL